jgi:hypothetical protein
MAVLVGRRCRTDGVAARGEPRPAWTEQGGEGRTWVAACVAPGRTEQAGRRHRPGEGRVRRGRRAGGLRPGPAAAAPDQLRGPRQHGPPLGAGQPQHPGDQLAPLRRGQAGQHRGVRQPAAGPPRRAGLAGGRADRHGARRTAAGGGLRSYEIPMISL